MNKYKITLTYLNGTTTVSTHELVNSLNNEDSINLSLIRDEQFEGVFESGTPSFSMVLGDKDYIESVRDDYYSRLDKNYKLVLSFKVLEPVTVEYEEIYNGRVEMNSIVISEYYADFNCEDNSTFSEIVEKQDITYSIDKTGIEYDYPIRENAVWDAKKNGFYYNYSEYFDLTNAEADLNNFNFRLEGAYVPLVWGQYNKSKVYFSIPEDLDTISIPKIDFKTTIGTWATTLGYFLYVDVVYSDGTRDRTTIAAAANATYSGGSVIQPSTPAAFDITIDQTKAADGLAYLNFNFSITYGAVNPAANFIVEIGDLSSDGFEIGTDFGTNEKTSKLTALPLTTITSDLATKLDMTIDITELPTNFLNLLISTARGLRGITDMTYNLTFEDLFNAIKSFMAMGLEIDATGVKFVTFDDIYTTTTYSLGEVDTLEESINSKVISVLNYGNSQGTSSEFHYGTQDYNNARQYDLGLLSEYTKELSNAIRVDASTLNKAAIDYQKDIDTTDLEADEDLYFVCRDASNDVRSRYTLVSGVDIDEFGYPINMEFAPSQQLAMWAKYLGHLITSTNSLDFTSAKKNKDLVYNDGTSNITDCPASYTDSNFPIVGNPYFGTKSYKITKNINYATYSELKTNKSNVITFTFKGLDYRGYLEELSFNPLPDKSEVELTLTEAYGI